jgi:hypothetical protein
MIITFGFQYSKKLLKEGEVEVINQDIVQIIVASVVAYIVNILFMQQYKSRHSCVKLNSLFSNIFLCNKSSLYINVWILIMQVFLMIMVPLSLIGCIEGFIDVQNIKLIKSIWVYFVIADYGFLMIDTLLFTK